MARVLFRTMPFNQRRHLVGKIIFTFPAQHKHIQRLTHRASYYDEHNFYEHFDQMLLKIHVAVCTVHDETKTMTKSTGFCQPPTVKHSPHFIGDVSLCARLRALTKAKYQTKKKTLLPFLFNVNDFSTPFFFLLPFRHLQETIENIRGQITNHNWKTESAYIGKIL